jgi:hypothetical protein
MNDNRDKFTGIHVRRAAYLLTDHKWFDFFRLLPDFIEVDVHDSRVTFGDSRQLTVQMADRYSFLHVTVYRFFAA